MTLHDLVKFAADKNVDVNDVITIYRGLGEDCTISQFYRIFERSHTYDEAED